MKNRTDKTAMKADEENISVECPDEHNGIQHEEESNGGEVVQEQKLKEEIDGIKNSLLRLQADFDNYRKRMEKERGLWLKYAIEPVLPDILDVVDDMERALEAGCKDDGMEAIHRKMKTMLEKHGVKEFKSCGEPFDPHYHDAVSVVPGSIERDIVKDVILKGYTLHDRVTRHARVVVMTPNTDNREEKCENTKNIEEE